MKKLTTRDARLENILMEEYLSFSLNYRHQLTKENNLLQSKITGNEITYFVGSCKQLERKSLLFKLRFKIFLKLHLLYIDMNNGRRISKLCNQYSKITVAIITCKLIKVDVYTKAISKKVFHDQCDQERFSHLNYMFSL